jgi:hypothetical protein
MSTAQQLTKNFAIGNAFINPVGGLLPVNASPFQLNTIQDISVEFTGKVEELRGQLLYAVDARLTDVGVKGKFTVGQWSLDQLNNLFFAGVISDTADGVDNIVPDEAHTVPLSAPYTIDVTDEAGWSEDLGVSYAANAQSFDRVTPSIAGQYTVAAGAYTFDIADAGAQVLISYVNATGSGSSLYVPNNLQGQSPSFEFVVWNPIGGGVAGYNGIRLYNCVAQGVKPLTAKNNKFSMNEVDFMAYCPSGDYVGELIRA